MNLMCVSSVKAWTAFPYLLSNKVGIVFEAEAIENLGWWEASGGSRLDDQRVSVQARKTKDAVDALIVPIH
jgi:hypothetical protein